MSVNEAIAELQMRLTYQDDDINALNLLAKQQQDQIDALRRDVEQLREMLSAIAQAGQSPAPNERPPHY